MENRRSRNALTREKASRIVENSARTPCENFIAKLLRHCEEYEVAPSPRFIVKNGAELFGGPEAETLKPEEDAPVLRVSFENPRKLENVQRLECRDKFSRENKFINASQPPADPPRFFALLCARHAALSPNFCTARQEVSICLLDALHTTLQRYRTLTVLKLPSCQVNAYGVLQIALMLTELETLQDVNLDDNPNAHENYYLLCAPRGNLRYLSLRMCCLSDNGIAKIASELKYRDPPGDYPKLTALNLADNDITDIGAGHIASMLRTNRSLQSVVLTGNKIHDDGASLIVQELCIVNRSVLTHEEVVDLRRRRFRELEGKPDSRQDTATWRQDKTWHRQNLVARPRKPSRRSSSSKSQIASASSNDSVQPGECPTGVNGTGHPFTRETMAIKGSVMASGNLALQHLSLSFNRLTNETLRKLVSCLYYQNYMLLEDTARGLLYVFLEGNSIREDEDWATLCELLHRRRQRDTTADESFRAVVPVESKELRSKMSQHASMHASSV